MPRLQQGLPKTRRLREKCTTGLNQQLCAPTASLYGQIRAPAGCSSLPKRSPDTRTSFVPNHRRARAQQRSRERSISCGRDSGQEGPPATNGSNYAMAPITQWLQLRNVWPPLTSRPHTPLPHQRPARAGAFRATTVHRPRFGHDPATLR